MKLLMSCAAVCLLLVGTATADINNLVTNGDFGDGTQAWFTGGTFDGFVALNEVDGNHFMYLENGGDADPNVPTADLRSELFAVPSNSAVKYSFDSGIWQETTETLYPVFQARFFDAEQAFIGQEFVPIASLADDWDGISTPNSGWVVPAVGTAYMDVVFSSGIVNDWQGGVRIDNVSVVSENLVDNGNFSVNGQASLAGWDTAATGGGIVRTWEEGGRQYMNLDWGSDSASSAAATSNIFAVPAGGTLNYSFDWGAWITNGQGWFELRYYDADQALIDNAGVAFALTHTGFAWQDGQSGTSDVPAHAAFADVRFSTGLLDDSDTGLNIDNVVVLVSQAPTAWSPTPEDGAIDVGSTSLDGDSVTVDLSWMTAKPAGDPNILTHYLYMSDADGSTLSLIDSIPVDGPAGQATITNLAFDSAYLWRVDQSVEDSEPQDAETIQGPVWSFRTVTSLVFLTQPQDVLANVGDNISFMVEADTPQTITYQWYKSADAIIDTAVDQPIGSPSANGELTLSNVQAGDEAYYYCEVEIIDTGTKRYSDMVTLGVRRQVAHWTLDLADYAVVGEDAFYLDSSGESNDAFVGGDPTFVGGIVTGDQNPDNLLENGAVQIAEASGWADVGSWNPLEFSGQFTVSTWFKWTEDAAVDWNVILSKRDGWTSMNDNMFQILLAGPSQSVTMGSFGAGFIATADDVVEPGTWHHLAVTYAAGPARIYLDGEMVAEVDDYGMANKTDATFWIGRNNDPGERFDGVLDDMQIFNYALDQIAVVDLYNAETGETICLWDDRPAADLSGDCKVGLEDFAIMAAEWLEYNWYPFVP